MGKSPPEWAKDYNWAGLRIDLHYVLDKTLPDWVILCAMTKKKASYPDMECKRCKMIVPKRRPSKLFCSDKCRVLSHLKEVRVMAKQWRADHE